MIYRNCLANFYFLNMQARKEKGQSKICKSWKEFAPCFFRPYLHPWVIYLGTEHPFCKEFFFRRALKPMDLLLNQQEVKAHVGSGLAVSIFYLVCCVLGQNAIASTSLLPDKKWGIRIMEVKYSCCRVWFWKRHR